MKAVVVYRDESDHAREVIDYLRDFEHRTGKTIETIDPDTPQGIQFCTTYDIMEYPCLVAMSDDGQMLNLWRGTPLPTITEVSYYA